MEKIILFIIRKTFTLEFHERLVKYVDILEFELKLVENMKFPLLGSSETTSLFRTFNYSQLTTTTLSGTSFRLGLTVLTSSKLVLTFMYVFKCRQ